MAGHKLVERGYRRIGLALESRHDAITSHAWTDGYALLQTRHPHLGKLRPFLPERMNRDGWLAWLRKERVECVLTLSAFHNSPNLMCQWLSEEGLSCPHEVGLASLDLSAGKLDWAGIDQDSAEISRSAVDLLLSKLLIGELGIPKSMRTLLVHSRWREGGSVRTDDGT